MPELTEGQYYYRPHRRSWGVWRVGRNGDDFVADFHTEVQARGFVYKANGWRERR